MQLEQNDLSNSVYMTLNSTASSSEAKALSAEIEADVALLAGKRKRLSAQSRIAVDSITADLIRTAQLNGRYCYRRTSSGSFTGERIGYDPFRRAIRGMDAAGLVEVVRGGDDSSGRAWASRFRATEKLLKLADLHGVTPAAWSSHFEALPRPRRIALPLVLRTDSTMVRGKKYPGRQIPIDMIRSPAARLGEQVNRLNEFFARVAIEPAESHYAFQRLFNQGDAPDFDWNKGGRLYSLGASYQQMKAVDRAKMMLNGEPVVEIDIRASHLTILNALLKQPFYPTKDPYQVAGLPRSVVKAWVTMTLGYDRFQNRWSKENKDEYKEESGGDLQKDHPIREVREKALAALPVLTDWPTCQLRWGDLQYVESCAVIEAVEELAGKDIPALPVHDSIIVPVFAETVAKSVLTDTFERHVGVKPGLSTK